MKHDDYIRLVCLTDVTLDPFPFGGGVTLTDTLTCLNPFRNEDSPASKLFRYCDTMKSDIKHDFLCDSLTGVYVRRFHPVGFVTSSSLQVRGDAVVDEIFLVLHCSVMTRFP
jgi:hypothetical protein